MIRFKNRTTNYSYIKQSADDTADVEIPSEDVVVEDEADVEDLVWLWIPSRTTTKTPPWVIVKFILIWWIVTFQEIPLINSDTRNVLNAELCNKLFL